MAQAFSIDKIAFQKALESAAPTYDDRCLLSNAIADRLLERLDFIRLNPSWVLDVGARTGYSIRELEKRYKKASVIGMDLSLSILRQCPNAVVGEYTAFPLEDQSVDLIFSNLTLQWSMDLQQTLQECRRILKPEGLLLFSTVGPDTLNELRASFSDKKRHVHPFFDMHDIGDMLTHLRFVDPVMDMEQITVHYSSVSQLLKDLKLIGAQNAARDRCKGLMGKMQWKKMLDCYENWRDNSGALPATIEVIYGHAFGAELAQFENKQGEIVIPINSIKRGNNEKN